MTDSNTTPEIGTNKMVVAGTDQLHTLFEVIQGPLKEFIMLRRAVNYLQAVPTENLGADGTAALTFILNHYSTYPKVGPVTIEFKSHSEETQNAVEVEAFGSAGKAFAPNGAQLEFTALKSFGIMLMSMVTANESLHPDVLNALSEFKSYHNI